jgi:hypothetical protein
LGTASTTGLLYQPRMIGDGDCGEIGGMKGRPHDIAYFMTVNFLCIACLFFINIVVVIVCIHSV